MIGPTPGFGVPVSQNDRMADDEVSGAVPDAPPVRATDETAELPVIVMPVVEPVVEEAPTFEPDVVEEAPTVEPDEVPSEVVEPEVIEAEVTEAEVVQPAVVEPEVFEPEVVEPEIVEPMVVEPEVAVPVAGSHVAPRQRRRWPWLVLGFVLGLLVALVAGGLWYVSGLIGAGARVPQPDAGFELTIDAVDGDRVSYSGVGPEMSDQGLMGIGTVQGGYVQTDDPQTSGAAGSRAVTARVLAPDPAAGQPAVLDGWYFPSNPLVGLGLPYEDVEIETPLGPAPAWLIPGTATTWVVYTHGRGAAPREGLRMASTVADLGYPMLLIRYRNDSRAPAGNGYAQFGVDEWSDLEGAVQYALDNGAERVVLAGSSMGGSVSLAFLQNSDLADRVVGAFLDAPLTDFGQVVELGAADRGIPGPVAGLAMRVAQWRFGFDFEAADYTADAGGFRTPMLIVQGTADTTVAPEVSAAFAAAAQPGLVTLELFEGAGHLLSWNVDRTRYEALLGGFLGTVAPLP